MSNTSADLRRGRPILKGPGTLIRSITHAVCRAAEQYILVLIVLLKTHLESEKESNDSMTAMEINQVMTAFTTQKGFEEPYQRLERSNSCCKTRQYCQPTKSLRKAPGRNSG